jgi:hypothetical protein
MDGHGGHASGHHLRFDTINLEKRLLHDQIMLLYSAVKLPRVAKVCLLAMTTHASPERAVSIVSFGRVVGHQEDRLGAQCGVVAPYGYVDSIVRLP